jgi:hypothetical protein
MDEEKVPRLNLILERDDYEWLKAISEANTAGNMSMFVRLILMQVKKKPAKFGVNPPKKEGKQ